MSTRNERRQRKKQLGRRVLDHPVTKRMKRNLREGGKAATEVFRLEGETPERHLYFDVYSMKKWAEAHGQLVVSTLCWDRVNRMRSNGAIDEDRLANHTTKQQMEPIIIGIDAAGPGEDQILDGSHRFFAYAMAASAAGMEGAPLPLPAYALEPAEWRQFLIPRFIAKAMRFDETDDDLSADVADGFRA
jgi:hypothetical protein